MRIEAAGSRPTPSRLLMSQPADVRCPVVVAEGQVLSASDRRWMYDASRQEGGDPSRARVTHADWPPHHDDFGGREGRHSTRYLAVVRFLRTRCSTDWLFHVHSDFVNNLAMLSVKAVIIFATELLRNPTRILL